MHGRPRLGNVPDPFSQRTCVVALATTSVQNLPGPLLDLDFVDDIYI
jgi:hypothetical protein